ncbi:MAG: hypothetical protein LBK99_16430 [Opitutaceae bacterium]|jgi:hypothetical protein|nr:hypothetical protein [Opitutaceae bacterium]
MYNNANAIIRPELSTLVEEAAAADKYFIASKVFPPFNSETATGQYLKITKNSGELQKKNVTERAPKSPYGRVDRTYVTDNFSCVDRGLEEALDDAATAKIKNFFGPQGVEGTTSKLVLRSVMLGHEDRVAGIVMNPANFDHAEAAVEYAAAAQETATPHIDIQNAIKRLQKRGELVNALVCNRDVFDYIRNCQKIATWLFGPLGGGQNVTAEMLAKAFGIEQIHIADATIDGSPKGKIADADYIWTPDYIWLGNVQGGPLEAGGAGRTIVFTGDAASLFVTETYRDEKIRSDIVRVRQHTDEKVVSQPCGTLIETGWDPAPAQN